MKTKYPIYLIILIGLLIIGGLVLMVYMTNLFGLQERRDKYQSLSSDVKTIRVGVISWGGYVGGEYFNRGFGPSRKSRYYKKYGIMVDFVLIDDFNTSRNAWKTGDIDLMWATVDMFTTEMEELKEFQPQIVYLADWSRGGDAIVVRKGINKLSDLKGKKISFAETTPSHTFLLWLLKSAHISYSDITPIKVANGIQSASLFVNHKVDAAVVWSPDDDDCLSKVAGSKILQSTREAPNLIADVFVAKKDFVDRNAQVLKDLFEGWMIGAAEINSSSRAKAKAAKILAEGLHRPRDFCLQSINNVRLCTYEDNINFFNINGDYTGTTGEDIYNEMSAEYAKLGYITGNIIGWNKVSNSSIIKSIHLTGPENAAEVPGTDTLENEN